MRILSAITWLVLQSLALQAEPAPQVQYQRYYRSVRADSSTGQACAVVDPSIFQNAAPALKDLRLYQGNREVPYAITLSRSAQPDTDSARVLNEGLQDANGGQTKTLVFDLEMPARLYTEVNLDIPATNFIATAKVSGMDAEHGQTPTQLGEFTLFDLTHQHLSRSTTLSLQESNFRFLHLVMTIAPAPGAGRLQLSNRFVAGATVPPSREAQTLFTVAATTDKIRQRGRQSVATFTLPTRVPVERVSFAIAADYKGNFSRDVRIFDRPQGAPAYAGEAAGGTIFRVRLTETGREIRQQQLSVPATIGSNLQGAADVEVVIDNGDDAPLPVTSVRLEMRQRKLCFDAASAPEPVLFYGDPALPAPQYDYGRVSTQMDQATHQAMLGPAELNPTYRPREDTRPLTERHPDTIWIVLLGVISLLALVAFRSTKVLPR
jgi:hypothetical protein